LIDEFGSIAFPFASVGGWLVLSVAISEAHYSVIESVKFED